MIAVLQRVKKASVSVDGSVVGQCGKGIYLLLGVSKEDSERDVEVLCEKICGLRIFTDENGKMNLSVADIDGEMLAVSNFTLLASYRKGKRPDYMGAAAPDEAKRLYDMFCEACEKRLKRVERGVFGAHMISSLETDGPVTIVMDSKVLLSPKNS